MTARVAALLAAAAVAGCAQPGVPPGGEPDETPPRVIEVRPSAFATLSDLDEPVVIRFDERLSERLEGIPRWSDAVLVSPATSPVEVDAGRRHIEVSLEDGWEPDRVYRVEVLPLYRDLFGNVRVEPVELVFSTGAPLVEGAVAGIVTDRITRDAEQGLRIQATRQGEEAPYVTVSDSGGFFAFRYMPAGEYALVAWDDANRDRLVDFFERQDRVALELAVDDTALAELQVLLPDTTPARLARAEALDSATVELLFDDHLVGPVDGSARVYLLPDSARRFEGRLVHPEVLDSMETVRRAAERAARAAAADSAARAADTLDVTVDTAAAPPPDTTPPPIPDRSRATREIILLLTRPLPADTTFQVGVEGVTNIRGVPGGGGTAPFRSLPPDTAEVDAAESPPPADSVPPGPA